ncbi:MAG: DUF1538 family protein, partial [Caryophanon sp.]|nr:DUF1538 family protein [Caryophanon sp.]
GPMTVPFIMALGLGVSSVRSDEDNSFGLTGITSTSKKFFKSAANRVERGM